MYKIDFLFFYQNKVDILYSGTPKLDYFKIQNHRKIGNGPISFIFIKEKEDGPVLVSVF